MNGRMKNRPLWIKLSWKYWHEKITEDVVESVALKVSGSAWPSRTDIEALQGWLLKFGDHSRSFFSMSDKQIHHGPPIGHLCPVT